MFLACVFDAVGPDGQPYFSPEWPRLVYPELRSRVIGYLATAPVARPGYRTDGVWVWPESLARHVRNLGVGPQPELLAHLAARRYLLPDAVGPPLLTRAADAVGGPATVRAGRRQATYYAGHQDRTLPPTHVLRRVRQADGAEHESNLTPSGWLPSDYLIPTPAARLWTEEIPQRRAAELVDELCSRWYEHQRRLGQETPSVGADLRLARVFDGQSSSGTAWFSPNRLRIVEPIRRNRLSGYLAGGRLVIRAAGRVPDPLEPSSGPVISLNYRTDGVWVWQEALSHYVRTRGAAPELDFLCHIEERGFQPPGQVGDDVTARAAIVARTPLPAGPERGQMCYCACYREGRPERLVRTADGDIATAEELDRDLRWRPPSVPPEHPAEAGGEFIQIDEEEAIRLLDGWCQRAFAALS